MRLADQEMADVQLDDLRQAGDRLRGRIIEPMAGMDLEARPTRRRARRCAATRRRPWRLAVVTASHQAPVWISMTGARSGAATSICRGSAR